MADHSNTFLLITLLGFLTILLVFGMKYFAAARSTSADQAAVTNNRALLETIATAQREQSAALDALRTDMDATKSRLASIDGMLKDVG